MNVSLLNTTSLLHCIHHPQDDLNNVLNLQHEKKNYTIPQNSGLLRLSGDKKHAVGLFQYHACLK